MKQNHITYHSDHLGSASFLTDNNGNETQQLVYLPFGEDWVDKKYNSPPYTTPYKFNGKEKDLESGYSYYGARYYYDWLSIWLSVDPLSDKYPHLTSYNYCANNPVMLVDPDGREIWITGQNYSYKYEYDSKVKYEGGDKFIENSITLLDQMYNTDAGGKVLSCLIESKSVYNITNAFSENGTAHFLENKNKKGGTLNMSGNIALRTLSHELFHGYQHENGQGGASIHNEIEAYLFEEIVNIQFNSNSYFSYGTFMAPINRDSKDAKTYDKSMRELLFGSEFSSYHFNKALKLFRSQSQANIDGVYNRYEHLQRPNQKQSLIKQFYPIIE